MSTAIKIELNELYEVRFAGEPTPAHFTKPTIEIFSASSDVTIRATTNPDFDGTYDELPVCTSEAQVGDVYVTDAGRAVRFVSFSCGDSSAEIYLSGFVVKKI